jgi:hypothetical protein
MNGALVGLKLQVTAATGQLPADDPTTIIADRHHVILPDEP